MSIILRRVTMANTITMDPVKMIPAKTELSIDGVPEFVPYKHITYADHHALVREYRALAAELKDKTQHVVDLEAQLSRVLDDNDRLKSNLDAVAT